jgi:hypothetical protein
LYSSQDIISVKETDMKRYSSVYIWWAHSYFSSRLTRNWTSEWEFKIQEYLSINSYRIL